MKTDLLRVGDVAIRASDIRWFQTEPGPLGMRDRIIVCRHDGVIIRYPKDRDWAATLEKYGRRRCAG